jgi:hypothetical protein
MCTPAGSKRDNDLEEALIVEETSAWKKYS